jgi:aspartyl aminopeptidase
MEQTLALLPIYIESPKMIKKKTQLIHDNNFHMQNIYIHLIRKRKKLFHTQTDTQNHVLASNSNEGKKKHKKNKHVNVRPCRQKKPITATASDKLI